MGNGPQIPDGNETIQSLAARIKAKYPVYADRPDADLVKRVIDKYPQYQKRLSTEELKKVAAGPVPSLWQEAKGVLSTAGEAAAKFYPQVVESTAAMLRQASPTGLSGAETARNIATPSGVTQSIAEAPAKSLAGKIALGAIPGTRTALSAADLAKRAAGGKPLTGESISQLQKDVASGAGQLAVAARGPEIEGLAGKALRTSPAEHLKLGLKDVDEGLGTSAGKAGRKAAAMTKDIRVAAPDLVAAADEVDPKLKGAEKLHDLAEKVAARKEEVWQKGHEPGFRAFGTREVEMAPVKKAAAKGLGKVGDWVNRPEANSARAWISGLPDRMTLNELDDFVRELNADLVNKDPRDAMGYGPKGIQARLNAVEEARNVIDKKLEDAGMPGVKDYNKRYGALKKIEDQLQVRAVQLARKEARNNLDLMPKWAHIYSFWHGHGIPFLALGIHGAGLFEKTPADVLFRGIDRLRKSGIQPTPFPATPPLPNIRGLLGEGPKIMSAVPDESYVRGVTAIAEAPEAIRKGRLLPQGEGVGPLTVGPSPLSPIAGSESTPTGGARGYPTQPQPKFPMTPYERVNVTQTEFPPSAAERTAQRQLPAGSAEVSPYRSGRTPTPGQIIKFQGAYWMFNGQDWEYIPANRLPPFPERKTR